jgi:hypothetical protein
MSTGFDWQFVIVTLAAGWGGWLLLRPLWAGRGAKKATGACGHCSSQACTQGNQEGRVLPLRHQSPQILDRQRLAGAVPLEPEHRGARGQRSQAELPLAGSGDLQGH